MKNYNSNNDYDLNEFLNNLPDAVIEIDIATRNITGMNRMAYILFGYSEDDFKRVINAADLFTESEYKRAVKYLEQYALESYQNKTAYSRTGIYETFDIEMLKKDKSAFIAETQGVFILDKNKVPVGIRVLIRDVTIFRTMEQSQRRRGNILDAISYATNRFLQYDDWDNLINEVITRIGLAAEVSRTYIFHVDLNADGEYFSRLQFEWEADGIKNRIADSGFKEFLLIESGFQRWVDELGSNRKIAGLTTDVPVSEQKILIDLGVRSILVVPIFCIGDWWGYIGFDDCVVDRVWSDATINALYTAADMFGAALARNKTEQELLENREKYRTILDNIEEGYFELDLGGNVTFANDSMCRIVGYGSDEIIGLNNRDYSAPETAARMYQEFNEIYKTGRPKEITDYEIIKKNGEPAILELSAILDLDQNDEPIGFRGVARDVTERKRATQLLRKSEQRYNNLYNEAPDMYFSVDPAGTIISVNQFGADYLGYTKQDLIGQPVWIVVHPDDLESVQVQVASILKERTLSSELEFRKVRKDGSELFVQERSRLIVDDQNNPVELRLICRDISDRKQAEQERQLALKKAQQSDQVKSMFLANMSHEIRTPLNSILGFSDLIEERMRKGCSDEEKTFFEIIKRSGKRLLRTIHEILDISEIEAGTYKIELKQVNLNEIVENVRQEMLPDAVDKHLNIIFDYPDVNILIRSNEYCVSQAMMNILDNAIKYTFVGQIKVNLNQLDKLTELIIEDSGIGISPEYIDRIYDKFTQESSGYTKNYQGVGLGLSLTKRYLNMVGAEINITSGKDTGTKVVVTFPSDKSVEEIHQPEITDPIQVETDSVDIENLSILFIEDDVNSQRLIKYQLSAIKDIRVTETVETAKRMIDERAPDIILLDLSLNDQESGLDLVRYLRQLPKLKDIPTIALTAHAFVSDRQKAITAGCSDYLPKPVKKHILLEKIRKYCQ